MCGDDAGWRLEGLEQRTPHFRLFELDWIDVTSQDLMGARICVQHGTDSVKYSTEQLRAAHVCVGGLKRSAFSNSPWTGYIARHWRNRLGRSRGQAVLLSAAWRSIDQTRSRKNRRGCPE
ncbi:hypothetical protein CONPUDRAFT_83896 [Coniophora puteana RWD-64-598 SS2]|uniref:Uncharacterized protein n=1 Tax=Coniophora puteana (strain RWD-64-598) TaxID=741705 RepID=A0A5M3MHJ6_CONPW|nr:uncharacterized protein CONPUDRAFT_83896 [Coniophora puteana RWD-64-598 SS2]EIW78527.1 hypothetical protein CONPUDRAFT_83896 [Coniophora puteana RWD-64-598 SS2]